MAFNPKEWHRVDVNIGDEVEYDPDTQHTDGDLDTVVVTEGSMLELCNVDKPDEPQVYVVIKDFSLKETVERFNTSADLGENMKACAEYLLTNGYIRPNTTN